MKIISNIKCFLSEITAAIGRVGVALYFLYIMLSIVTFVLWVKNV